MFVNRLRKHVAVKVVFAAHEHLLVVQFALRRITVRALDAGVQTGISVVLGVESVQLLVDVHLLTATLEVELHQPSAQQSAKARLVRLGHVLAAGGVDEHEVPVVLFLINLNFPAECSQYVGCNHINQSHCSKKLKCYYFFGFLPLLL